ncbi:MAG: DUF262 domain-containing protein [Janthinobacterium lividum]
MKAFDVRAYAISDFREWYNDDKLELSPKFQRRSVWTTPAKAFLADTILKGKPFPKIILMQEFKDGRTIRVVVDGQQRLRAIFDFLNDGIKISRAHSREHAGKVFSQLPQEMQDDFLQYEIGCDVLNSAPLSELLDIFARINRYTVKLNSQEMRNATYSGYFKSAAYDIAYQFVDHWLSARIVSESGVSRMAEAELSSDLLGNFLNQVQSSKSIDIVYKKYEDEEGEIPSAYIHLVDTINFVASIYNDDELKDSAWKSKHMYFSLVLSIGHVIKPISGLNRTNLTIKSLENREKVKSVLNYISTEYNTYSPQPKRSHTPEHLKSFIRASTLATTDTQARVIRSNFILQTLEENIGS